MSSFKDRFRQKAPAASPRTQISQPSINSSAQPSDTTTTNVAQLMPTSVCSPPRPSSVITSTTSPPSGGHQQQPSAALLQVLSAQTSPLRTPSSINLEMQKTPLDLSSSDLQHLPQPGAPHASTISQNIFGAVSPPQQNNSATVPIPTAPSNSSVKALYLPASVQHHHHGVGGQEPSLNSPHLMIHTSSTLSSLASMGDLTRQGSTTLTGGITTPVRGARVNALLEHAEQQAAHRGGGGGGSLNTPKRSAHYSIAGNSRGKESPAPAPAIPSPTHASPHGRLDDGPDAPVNAQQQQQQNRTVGNASPASFSGRKISSFSSVALHSLTGRSGSRTRLIGQQQLSSDQLHSPGQALARKFDSASPATPMQDQVLPRTGTKPGASASSYRSLLPEEGSPVSTLLGPLHNQSCHQATAASSTTRHNTAISTFARNLADELQVATAMSSASSYPVVQGNYSSTNTTCLGGSRQAHGVVGTPSPRSALAVPDAHAAAASYNNSNGNPLLLHVPRPGSADSSCLTTGRIESTIRDIIGDATLRRVTDFEASEQQRRLYNNNLVAGKSPAHGGSDEDDSGEDRLGSTQQIIENDNFIALESTSEVVFLGTALADALRASGGSGTSSRGFVAAEATEAIRIVNYDDEVGKYVGGACIGGDDDINIGNCNCSDNDIQQFFPGFDLRKYKAAEVFHHCVECHRRPASFLCLNCFQAVCPSHVHTHYHKGTSTATTLSQKPNTNSLCFLYLNMLDVEHSFDRQLWCERCQRFTWKCADTYEPLVEQLLYSKGSYLPGDPITDVHIVAYKSSDPIQNAAATVPPALTSQSLIGELLSSPTSEPQPENHLVPAGESALLPRRQWTALAGTVQGWRASQEDAEAVFQLEFPRHLLGDGHTGAPLADSSPYVVLHCFAVFDGHGGDAVAELVAAGLPRHLQSLVDARYGSSGARLGDPASEHAKNLFASPGAHGGELQQQQHPDHLLRSAICDIMEDGFMSFDEGLRNSKEGRQGDFNCVGCTASVVGAYSQQSSGDGDALKWTLVTANLGDSGAAAIVLRPALDGELVEPALSMITTAHRIDGAEEARRIKAAGYSIQGGRIEGLLAVPRAFGDFDFKQCGGDREARDQAVTSCPEVSFFGEDDDTFGAKQTLVGLVVGCDGLWDSHKHPERDIARLLFKPTPSVQQQANIFQAKVQHPQRLLTSLAAPTTVPAAAQSNPRSVLSPISEGDREMFADFNRVAADADAYSKTPFASFGESGSNGGAVDAILNVLFGTMTASMADDDEYGAAHEDGGAGASGGDSAGEDVDTEAHDRGTDNCSIVLAVLW